MAYFFRFPFGTAFIICGVMNIRALRAWLLVLSAVVLAGEFLHKPTESIPAASPACTLSQRIGLTDITVVYSRPSEGSRHLRWHCAVPGQVWRTGANQATKVTFSTPVKLEGHAIPAGAYALFTIPAEDEWTIILSTNVNQWARFNTIRKTISCGSR